MLSNAGWQNLTKEQLAHRKEEWKCIRKTLKEIEIIFEGSSYVNSHKHLFFLGELNESTILDSVKNSSQRFGYAFGPFFAWYHPSDDPEILWEYLLGNASCSNFGRDRREVLFCFTTTPNRLCRNYGYLGPKTELLVRLLCRGIRPKKISARGKEYDVGVPVANVLDNFCHLKTILKGRGDEGTALKYNVSYYFDYLISDAYEYSLASDSPDMNYQQSLGEVFYEAFLFFKVKSEITDCEYRRYARYRVLNMWFNRTYSETLLRFIDEIAEQIGYEASWEKVGLEYGDRFVTRSYDLPPLDFL